MAGGNAPLQNLRARRRMGWTGDTWGNGVSEFGTTGSATDYSEPVSLTLLVQPHRPLPRKPSLRG